MSACVFTDWTWFIRTGSWFSGLWIVYINDNNAHCKASRENISIHILIIFRSNTSCFSQRYVIPYWTSRLPFTRPGASAGNVSIVVARAERNWTEETMDVTDVILVGFYHGFFMAFFTCFLIGKPSINGPLMFIYDGYTGWWYTNPSEKSWNSSVGDTIPKWMEK